MVSTAAILVCKTGEFNSATVVRPEGCEENLYLGDIWSRVGQWFHTKLAIQQGLSANCGPHRVSKSHGQTLQHFSEVAFPWRDGGGVGRF